MALVSASIAAQVSAAHARRGRRGHRPALRAGGLSDQPPPQRAQTRAGSAAPFFGADPCATLAACRCRRDHTHATLPNLHLQSSRSAASAPRRASRGSFPLPPLGVPDQALIHRLRPRAEFLNLFFLVYRAEFPFGIIGLDHRTVPFFRLNVPFFRLLCLFSGAIHRLLPFCVVPFYWHN